MSGEVVLISSALGPLGVLGGALGVAVATVASRTVTAYLDSRRAEATRAAVEEQQRSLAWRDFQVEQARHMATAQLSQAAFRGQLAALQLTAPSVVVRTEGGATRGFLAAEDVGLASLGAWFAALPVEIRAAPDFPVGALEGQWRRLQAQVIAGNPPAMATVVAFRMALEQTLATHLARLDQERALHAGRLTRVEGLLEETLRCLHMLVPGSGQEVLEMRLAVLRDGLFAHLAAGEVSEGALEALERQGATLTTEVNSVLERIALRAALRDRTATHLADLGYTMAMTEEEGGQWRIPGGEQVRLRIQRDHRLAFQVFHERPAGTTGPLNATEQTRLHTQEARWCADAKELLRRLIRDGFSYTLQFERTLSLVTVPVVVVESADELTPDTEEDEWEDYNDEPKRKMLE
ncbi:conserved hypothetical protein [Gammaproteobacteria bacterium]